MNTPTDLIHDAVRYRRTTGRYPRVIQLYGSLAREFRDAYPIPPGSDPDWHVTVCGARVELVGCDYKPASSAAWREFCRFG